MGTGRKPPTEIKNLGACNEGCWGKEGWAFWFISWMSARGNSAGRVQRQEDDPGEAEKNSKSGTVTYQGGEDGGHTCSLGETHYSLIISFSLKAVW